MEHFVGLDVSLKLTAICIVEGIAAATLDPFCARCRRAAMPERRKGHVQRPCPQPQERGAQTRRLSPPEPAGAQASAPGHPSTKKLTVDELQKHDNFTR